MQVQFYIMYCCYTNIANLSFIDATKQIAPSVFHFLSFVHTVVIICQGLGCLCVRHTSAKLMENIENN
jgi:hypothetical protein